MLISALIVEIIHSMQEKTVPRLVFLPKTVLLIILSFLVLHIG